MRILATISLVFICMSLTKAQDSPTITIDIPTNQKPFNHLDWNKSPSQFQFAIVTDRTGGHRPGIFLKGIHKLNLLQPEFVMSVGDLIEGYTEDTAQLHAEWREFKGFIDSLQAPFFYVPGNHDITNKTMSDLWHEMFGVSYYHFVYNDVLFLCLNSEDNYRGAGRGTIDDEQFEYVKKILAENPDVKWTLAFMHQPLWVQEDTKRWKDVEKLLSDRNHYVFAGHYHRYWKTDRNNGNYIALATTGGGSQLRGRAYGEFDHVVWVTMTEEGPILANLFLDGIWDENVVTEELVELVRDRPFPVSIAPMYARESDLSTFSTTVRVTNRSETRMDVELEGRVHPKLHYQLEKESLNVEPNDVATFELTIDNQEQMDIRAIQRFQMEAEITYRFEDQPNVNFANMLNFIPHYRYTTKETETKVKIDGKLKDWNSDWIEIKDWSGKPFDYDGKEDCSVKFSTSYDEDNFYVAVDIRDEELYTDEAGSYWQQDAVVIGLDARAQHISAFNRGDGRGRNWLAILRTFKDENPVYGKKYLPANIESAAMKTEDGMHVELAIPVSYLDEMQQKSWETIRLGVGYYDFDAEGREQTSHFWFPAWNTEDDIPGSGMIFKK